MTELTIFDLDGTLLDTIGDLAVACNAALALRGLPQHSYEEYCGFVGNGILRLVERALPEPLRTPHTVAAVRRDFVEYYTAHIDLRTRPYEGIPELLRTLADRGVRSPCRATGCSSSATRASTCRRPQPPAYARWASRGGSAPARSSWKPAPTT